MFLNKHWSELKMSQSLNSPLHLHHEKQTAPSSCVPLRLASSSSWTRWTLSFWRHAVNDRCLVVIATGRNRHQLGPIRGPELFTPFPSGWIIVGASQVWLKINHMCNNQQRENTHSQTSSQQNNTSVVWLSAKVSVMLTCSSSLKFPTLCVWLFDLLCFRFLLKLIFSGSAAGTFTIDLYF